MYPPIKDERKPSLTKKLQNLERQLRAFPKDDRVNGRIKKKSHNHKLKKKK